MSDTVQPASNEDSIEFNAGTDGVNIKLKGNKLHKIIFGILFVFFLIGGYVYFSNKEILDNAIDKIIHADKATQKKAFEAQYNIVARVLTNWDDLTDINDISMENVNIVKNNITTALNGHKTLKTDLLDHNYKITWLWHLARLHIISADVTPDYLSIARAIITLEQLEEYIEDREKFDESTKQFINNNRLDLKIQRTFLIAYALGYDITKSAKDFDRAQKIFIKMGKCAGLKSKAFRHNKIKAVFGCTYTY